LRFILESGANFYILSKMSAVISPVDAIAGKMWLDRVDGGDKIFTVLAA
jgi:hypothetical protein